MVAKTDKKSSPIKNKILLVYPYYWPTYKAGGPVQSLFNLVSYFKADAEFFLVSSNKDIDGSLPEQRIEINRWAKGPNNENIFFVDKITPLVMSNVIAESKPDVIFINGLFNVEASLSALFFARLRGIDTIISPRGMLQAWGLKRNAFLKKIVLTCFRLLVKKNSKWHATDQQERSDIQKHFGTSNEIFIAPNIPRKVSEASPIEFPDETGKIKLVFLSLINPNKNLHLVIDAVNANADHFSLDIYGPIIDKNYWSLCKQKIRTGSCIYYKGSIPSWQVPDVLPRYHFFVLPTQGENFGHAIFDSLGSGLPVIISKTTPWQKIDEFQAGFYIDLENASSLHQILEMVSTMSQSRYATMRAQSLEFARNYWAGKNYGQEYSFLISQS